MIYNTNEYKIKYYKDSRTACDPVFEYIENLDAKHRLKIRKYIEYLRSRGGYLDEPYGRHIQGKIRELRVDFSFSRHRILYFSFVDKNIVLLHAFLKKTAKTPEREIEIAISRYNDFINNYEKYDSN